MSRRGQPWFRMWAEFRSDPKVQLLAFDDQRHFVCILCMKCEGILDSPSGVVEFRNRLVSKGLGLDPATTAEVKRRLLEVGLIADDWQPVKWEERQFSHDVSTQRVQRHRQRLRNGGETFHETGGNVSRNGSATVPERESDSESDTDPEGEGARATRFPSDFELTPARRAAAVEIGIPSDQVGRVFGKFRDHYRASPSRARGRDWDAQWRLWCRREPEFAAPRGRQRQAGATQEEAGRALRSIGERMKAGGGS